ncbi:early boundary activity protein 1-like [Danaus plexippus]|uniref:early boundary activity protein 1-like n=1 Tax=Danaus plexippus TaxID=13037 RepID=UPI002AB2F4B9|nr:early boundary activity protein 1-like [Danaus plexippus]
MKIEKWLLADWSTSRRMQEVIKVSEDMKVVVTPNQEDDKVTITEFQQHNISDQNRQSNNESGSVPVKSVPEDEVEEDYSPSGSSWEPTDKSSSSSEDSDKEEIQSKTMKMEQYIRRYSRKGNSKKALVPVHRPNAVVNVLKERQINENNRSHNSSRKRKYKEFVHNKSLPDSTRKNPSPSKEVKTETLSINVKDLLDIKASFEELFRLLNDLKPETGNNTEINSFKDITTHEKSNIPSYESEHSEDNQSEDLNRSDDNVLITNKYSKARVISDNSREKQSPNNENEWIPIGSGKTLIHKDKYRKVNWKSYTIATRTLLLATFPRRILATHSLTGKRSPAFQNKPAKMCLDPKIVSDIILEITSKFKVKENLVRSIITTKCADECKMYKSRTKNKKIKDQENLPPAINAREETHKEVS